MLSARKICNITPPTLIDITILIMNANPPAGYFDFLLVSFHMKTQTEGWQKWNKNNRHKRSKDFSLTDGRGNSSVLKGCSKVNGRPSHTNSAKRDQKIKYVDQKWKHAYVPLFWVSVHWVIPMRLTSHESQWLASQSDTRVMPWSW